MPCARTLPSRNSVYMFLRARQLLPDVFKTFMEELMKVASLGKDKNTAEGTYRQLLRCFHVDDRPKHVAKEEKVRKSL